MGSPSITSIRFRTSPFVPASNSGVDGDRFKDIFRVMFTVQTPGDLACSKWKIHVEIWEDDDASPDDLITGSPFPIDHCYELKPATTYTFYIGNVDPFGKKLPQQTHDAAAQTTPLEVGAYTLPGYAPITFSGDPGNEYEFYASAILIPCGCEEEDEISFDSQYQHSKQVGGKDVLEKILEWIQRLGGAASGAASAVKGE